MTRPAPDPTEENTMTDPTRPNPTPEQKGVDLTAAGVAGWYLVLEQVAAKREELNTVEKQAQDAIKTALGDRVDGLINGTPVVRHLHTAAPRKFLRKAFAKDHPDLEKQYIEVGKPGRRFELVKPKAAK